MSSFIVTTKVIDEDNIDKVNYYTKFRGLNRSSVDKFDKLYIADDSPIVQGDMIAVYDGATFNCDDSDILSIFSTAPDTFAEQLDGEYAIVIYDMANQKIFIYTDPFATKPVYYSCEDGHIGIASYKHPLEELGFTHVDRVKASTQIKIDVATHNVTENIHSPYNLDENVDTYDICIAAFEQAVLKRCSRKCALGLSGGYDSGAIFQATINTKCPDVTCYYVDAAVDDQTMMKQRLYMAQKYKRIDYTTGYIAQMVDRIEKAKIFAKLPRLASNYDCGMPLQRVYRMIRQDNINVFISGEGSRVIYGHWVDDTGKMRGTKIYKPHHPRFFNNLKEQFPWIGFYESSDRIEADEECGAYGIQILHPFLDKSFVQSFFNLTPELKNKKYKNVICEYMERNDTPFTRNRKEGLHAPR